MSRIQPISVSNEDNFDGLDELHNVDYHLHRGTKTKRRTKKKVTTRLDGEGDHRSISRVITDLVVGKKALYVGVPFTAAGILLSMLLQLSPLMQRYNTVIILALSVAVEFKYFPTNSVRAQLILAVVSLLSIAVDIFQICTSSFTGPIIAAVVFQIVFKLGLLNAFLRNSQSAVRTRKYLNRRFRLFVIPWHQPRRIMRDVRGRIVAIGWMQLVATVIYFLLFILLYAYLDFSAIYLGPASTSSISTFLLIKVASSLLALTSILYDTDVRLTLWHFGCLGWAINYVRNYITRKRIELKGFPLIYAFSKYRFQVVQFLKGLDFVWGLYGWVIVSYSFGTNFYSIGLRMQTFCGAIVFCLVVFDLWVVVLFLGVRWLLKRQRTVLEIAHEAGEEMDSDDSEIEEFGLRASVEDRLDRDKDKAALAEARRKLYYLRMRAEETRLAEQTAGHDARGRLGLSGMADWVSDYLHWEAKSTNVVQPDAGALADAGDGSGAALMFAEDDLERAVQSERTHTHPMMKHLQRLEGSGQNASRNSAPPPTAVRGKAGRDAEMDNEQIILSALKAKAMPGSSGPSPGALAQLLAKGGKWKDMLLSGKKKVKIAPDSSIVEEGREAEPEQDIVSPLQQTALGEEGKSLRSGPIAAATTPSTPFDTTFSMAPEDFAGIWEMLLPTSVSRHSTVRVAESVHDALAAATTTKAVAAGSPQLRVLSRQLLLTQVLKHLQQRGFTVAAAGLHEQRVIKIFCYAKVARGSSSAQASSVGDLGLLEVKLHPAEVGGADGGREVYLLECACRCKDKALSKTYLGLLSLQDILEFVD